MRATLKRLATPLLAAAVVALAASPALPGSEGVMTGGFVFVPPPPVVFVPPSSSATQPTGTVTTVSNATTDRVVRELDAAVAFCRAMVHQEYAVDCLSDKIETTAKTLPATGDYADARAALLTAADKLHALAQANADPRMPRGVARSTGPDGGQSSRPLTPVRPESLPSVKRQAAAIMGEAKTVLLRSAETSARRKVHYERIAAAVGSVEKVLLRSS